MKIAHQTVVQMHYTLKDDNGKVLDSSVGKTPLEYIQGLGMIVPGLEKAMVGKDVGEKFDVKVIPAEGYGEHNPALVSEIPLTDTFFIKPLFFPAIPATTTSTSA